MHVPHVAAGGVRLLGGRSARCPVACVLVNVVRLSASDNNTAWNIHTAGPDGKQRHVHTQEILAND
eukprot:26598-Eustigmatos_ZCMA.PRE.1